MNRRLRRRKRMIRLALALLILVAGLAVVFLFRVRKVNVYGNSRHSQEEIAQGLMHNFLTENTLYLQWEYRNETVPDTLPFLNSLKVSMKSPVEIDVTVEEKELAGYVDKGDCVYFDANGLVLEITDQVYDDLPIITGADIDDPVLYQKLPTASSAQLRTILSITQLLKYHELSAQEIRFGDNMEITVYIDGVEAMLGQDEYMEEKIANLAAILRELENQPGTLHLESFTGNEATPFSASPETETETDSTADTGAEDGTSGNGTGSVDGGTTGDGTAGDTAAGADGAGSADGQTPEDGADEAADEDTASSGVTIDMVFDSSGTLVYNVHVENGTVVDSSGNPVSGVTINEDGNIVDAYMNVFDSETGQLIQ